MIAQRKTNVNTQKEEMSMGFVWLIVFSGVLYGFGMLENWLQH